MGSKKKKEKKKKKDKNKAKNNLGKDEIIVEKAIDFEKVKLCKLAKKDYLANNMEQFLKLAQPGQFVCEKCGRIAAKKKNLCSAREFNSLA